MTAELLQRYHSGLCNEEERKRVVEWLMSPEPDNSVFSIDEEACAEQRIWHEMTAQREIPEVKFPRNTGMTFWLWFYAACLLLFCFLGAGWIANRPMALDNMNGIDTKTVKSDGLVFRLAPKSSVEAKRNFWRSAGNIQFCGVMEITNHSGKDIELVFNSTCKKSDFTQKKVICKSGKSYIAMHHFLKQDEIIVVNRDRGEIDLPGAVMI